MDSSCTNGPADNYGDSPLKKIIPDLLKLRVLQQAQDAIVRRQVLSLGICCRCCGQGLLHGEIKYCKKCLENINE